MALHGEICVNGVKISNWWAVRREGKPSDGWLTYDCGWQSGGLVENFEVRHHYEDGAETLAMMVLEASPWRRRKVERRYENYGSDET